MIDLYTWPTPNGHKITMFLEETGLPYTVKPVNISRGEQFALVATAVGGVEDRDAGEELAVRTALHGVDENGQALAIARDDMGPIQEVLA